MSARRAGDGGKEKEKYERKSPTFADINFRAMHVNFAFSKF